MSPVGAPVPIVYLVSRLSTNICTQFTSYTPVPRTVAPEHEEAVLISVQQVRHEVLVLAYELLPRDHVVDIRIVGLRPPCNSGSSPAEETTLNIMPDAILTLPQSETDEPHHRCCDAGPFF
jgi:hypothetical protein